MASDNEFVEGLFKLETGISRHMSKTSHFRFWNENL